MITIVDIFFLPVAYWLILVVGGVIAGAAFRADRRALVISLLLFAMFSLPQLVFRVNNGEEPGRLVGQFIYYSSFLAIAGVTTIILNNKNGPVA